MAAEGTFKHVFTAENAGTLTDFYDVAEKLGEGTYGLVEKGTHKDTKNVRAIKTISRKASAEEQHRLEIEIAIQQKLDHPHIVKLYEVFKDAKKIYLVMELCTGGELFDRIIDIVEEKDDGTAFGENQAATYMQQIIGAMSYLHANGYCHRDIKPENFLMQNKDKDAVIKIIDFGLSAKFEAGKDLSTKAGTPYYVAPEVLAGKYNEKCDVWSCGVIAYILLCGVPPFYGDTDPEILAAVKKGEFDFPSPEWDEITPEGKGLITEMLTMSTAKRPAFSVLSGHAWLSSHVKKSNGKLHSGLKKSLESFGKKSKLKKLALTCIAQQLNDEEIKQLSESFKTLDVNGDGTLTIKELTDGMALQKIPVPEAMLKGLDTDGSGSIDYTEFIAATLDQRMYHQDNVMWAAFRTFDKDFDGKITKKELKAMAGESTTADEIAQMIREADTDGDGEISFEEFKAMLK